jgi:hypothetical protein
LLFPKHIGDFLQSWAVREGFVVEAAHPFGVFAIIAAAEYF